MSEVMNTVEANEVNGNLINVKNSRKHKHNSKRRKPKKSQNAVKNIQNSNAVDEVVSFLCSSIKKNESETSVEMISPVKASTESMETMETMETSDIPTLSSSLNVSDLPSTSSTDLSCLLENLQVHASKNPINPKNVTEFLNVDLLKKTNCGTLSVEELEKIRQERCKKTPQSPLDPRDIPKDKVKEYFNLNLIKKTPERSVIKHIETSSMMLASELESTLCKSNVPEGADSKKYLTEYFNVNALRQTEDNIVTSIKSTTQLLVSELEKSLLKNEVNDKPKKVGKKMRQRKSNNCLDEDTDAYDGKQKVFLNSGLLNKNSISEGNCSMTETPKKSPSKAKKKQNSNKATPKVKEDTKFPKYLSPEELESLSHFGVLLTGIIRINQKNYKEAYITAPDKGMDIIIEGLKDRNRALEGDEVYFVLKPKEHHRVGSDSTDAQRTAVVVGIKIFNHNRGAIGSLRIMPDKNVNFFLFSPRDSKLPRIRIKRSDCPPGFFEDPDSFKDKLYFAKIVQWNDMRFAEGKIEREVGMAGDIEAETSALLLKYNLDVTPYPDTFSQYYPATPFHIPKEELSKREDLRTECIFTIDPATARDLDDAVSCKVLPNGNYEVGVHISDVSYFLHEGTPLDQAVSERATSIYLVQEVHHMLPRDLCQMCSLTPGEDKLGFSVIWEMTPDMTIVHKKFVRSVINSCCQLSYEQVQAILDNPNKDPVNLPTIFGGHAASDIKKIVIILNRIATHFRTQRFESGALKIDQTKITFALDTNGNPQDFFVYVNQESHRLIEEFMLLANITVAEELYETFPSIAFLRCHSPPLNFVLEKLQKQLEKYGIILDIASSGTLQSSLLKYSGEDLGSLARVLVLNNVLAKPMARAKYYCAELVPDNEDRRHYALNVPLYTHFTSPIRRYADVMVHRLLAASLGYIDTPKWDVDAVGSIACNCNKQKYGAKMASEMSTELFLSIYIGMKGKVVCDAVVCDIKDRSFDCIILSTGAHQRIYFEHIEGKRLQEEEDGIYRLKVIWPPDERHPTCSIQIVEMFSIVKVELRRTAVLKIEGRLLRYD